jgi:hypothetical protein
MCFPNERIIRDNTCTVNLRRRRNVLPDMLSDCSKKGKINVKKIVSQVSRYRDRWYVKQENLKLKKRNRIREKCLDDFWYTFPSIFRMCVITLYTVYLTQLILQINALILLLLKAQKLQYCTFSSF